MKAEEARKMTMDEIDAKIDASKKEYFTLRVQAKTGKLEKQHKIKALKRDIARLLTIKSELQKEELKAK